MISERHCFENLSKVYGLDPQTGKGGLYIGDMHGARNLTKLAERKITHVLTVLPKNSPQFKEYACHGIVHLHLAAEDTLKFDMSVHFEMAVKFISRGREIGNVVVHCARGISRSATLILAYLIYETKLPYEACLETLKKARPLVKPNAHFANQLRLYQKSLV